MVVKKIILLSALTTVLAACDSSNTNIADDVTGIVSSDGNNADSGDGNDNDSDTGTADNSGAGSVTGSGNSAGDESGDGNVTGSGTGEDSGDGSGTGSGSGAAGDSGVGSNTGLGDSTGSDSGDGSDIGSGDSTGSDSTTGDNGGSGNGSSDDSTNAGGFGNGIDAGAVNEVNGSAVATCVETGIVGDGWGWDGSQSCRIAAATGFDDATNNDSDAAEVFDASEINLLGFVKLYPDRAQADFSRALFGRLPSSFTVEQIQNYYAPAVDTCQVVPVTSDTNDEPQFTVLDQQLNLISSGETVEISSAAGSFATLNRVQNASGPSYQTEVNLSVDTPSGLSVDVLGDEFPAFSGVAISDVPALQMTNPPQGQNIDAYNFFTWNSNNAPLSVFEIYTGGVGANNQQIVVGCTVVDDGSFVFPNSVRSQMGNNFDDNWTVYLRVVYNISQDGDAMLVTANSVFGAK